MGSFNTTCAISHATINVGNKVRLFYIQSLYPDYGIGFQCEPWNDYTLISGAGIPATYADRNEYEFDENSLFAQYVQNEIKSKYVENVSVKGEDYNKYHDHMNVKVEDLTWQKIHEMIHNGRLFVRSLRGNKTQVATFAIHEAVYQMMIGSKEKIEIKLHELLSFYGNTVASKKQLEADFKSGKITYEQKAHEIDGLIINIKSEKNASKIDFGNLNQANAAGGFLYKHILMFAEKNGFENSEEEVFHALAETECLLDTMLEQNLMIRPVISSREDDNAKDTMKFLRELADAVATVKSRWEEDDEVIKTYREVKEWQEINLSDIKPLCSPNRDKECYNYFCKLIEGEDKLIIHSDKWRSAEEDDFYDQLADILRYSLDKDIDLHILNK